MAVLLLLNGPPGVGKSTLARRYVDDHPLALIVEVDALRVALGQWREHEESKQLARTLALSLIDAHLRKGRDVVVPQFLGRPAFIEALAEVATRHRATFVEIMVIDDDDEVLRRFGARRADHARSGGTHPEDDVAIDDLSALVATWFARLDRIRAARPDTRVVSARDGLDEACRRVVAAVTDVATEAASEGSSADGLGLRWNAVCLDCRHVDEVADFYRRLLGWAIVASDGDWVQLGDPAGGVGLNIQAEPWYEPPVWPERPGEPTKMLHLEIEVDDVDASVRRAEGLGARTASHQPTDRDPSKLRVMLDPAGHPFCLWTR